MKQTEFMRDKIRDIWMTLGCITLVACWRHFLLGAWHWFSLRFRLSWYKQSVTAYNVDKVWRSFWKGKTTLTCKTTHYPIPLSANYWWTRLNNREGDISLLAYVRNSTSGQEYKGALVLAIENMIALQWVWYGQWYGWFRTSIKSNKFFNKMLWS